MKGRVGYSFIMKDGRKTKVRVLRTKKALLKSAMQNLQEQIKQRLVQPCAATGYTNAHETPSIMKVSIRLRKGKDAKFADVVAKTIRRITGQQPVRTKAKQSIAGFKIREGMVVGVMVTLLVAYVGLPTKLTNTPRAYP